MATAVCEFACTGNFYDLAGVRLDAYREIQGVGRLVRTEFVGAGCLLKVFNDGQELPIEQLPDGRRDVTCVGQENDTCPNKQGFILRPIVKREVRIETARLL